MRAIIQSYTPKECEQIASGRQTIKVCKTAPKETPFKVYMYRTKERRGNKTINEVLDGVYGGGKVIGEYVCDWTGEITPHFDIPQHINQYLHHYPAILGWNDCMSFEEMKSYLGNRKGRDLHISQLKIYDEPKELRSFLKPCDDKYQYCQACKHGVVVLSPDEEEFALYHGGSYETFDTVCLNHVKRPPQSWCYVEEQDYDKTRN